MALRALHPHDADNVSVKNLFSSTERCLIVSLLSVLRRRDSGGFGLPAAVALI
jgi:hypothetical protein